MSKHKSIRLKNGLKIAFFQRSELKGVYFSVSVGAGTIQENEENIGAAHFFEHMLFEGTEKYPNSMKLGWALEQIGGKSTAWSDRDYVQYSVSIPKDNIESGLEYLSQILFHPLILKSTVATEKKIITEEYNRKLDNNETEAWEKFMEHVFGTSSYLGRSVLGTVQAINDLDESILAKYFNTYYVPNNMSLSVVGDFEYKEVLKIINRFFGQYHPKKIPTKRNPGIIPNTQHFSILTSNYNQSQIVLGFLSGVNIHNKNTWIFKIIRSLLGFGFGAKIVQKLVYDKGISYATAVWNISYQDTGIFLVSCGVSELNVPVAVNEILKEFAELKTKKISKEELSGIVKQTLSEEYYLHDTPEYFASSTSTDLLLKEDVETIDEKKKLLENVSPEDIQRIAKKYFTRENLYLLVMGAVRKKTKDNVQKITSEFM